MIAETESNLVLAVENSHVATCGRPPNIRHAASDTSYIGFFAYRFGEQWVLTIDRDAKTGVLRGGDIRWDSQVEIQLDANQDEVVMVFEGQPNDLILGEEERQWLGACWAAACED